MSVEYEIIKSTRFTPRKRQVVHDMVGYPKSIERELDKELKARNTELDLSREMLELNMER